MKNKAPLMLMEIMVLMLVFAFSAALCIKAFVKSDEISRRSEARDNAVTIVENAAETLRHNGGDLAKTASELGADLDGEYCISARYDGNMEKTDTGGVYTLSITTMPVDRQGLGGARIYMSEKNNLKEELFGISVVWQEAGNEE